MTDKLTIEQIHTINDLSDIAKQRQRVAGRRDYLDELKTGAKHATKEQLNASSLSDDEDVAVEIHELGSIMDPIEAELKQLDIIDEALTEREKELRKADEWQQSQPKLEQPTPIRTKN
jgi:hypothetical protein